MAVLFFVRKLVQCLVLVIVLITCHAESETEFEAIARETGLQQLKYVNQKEGDTCFIPQPHAHHLAVWCPLDDRCSVSTFNPRGVKLDIPLTLYKLNASGDCYVKNGEKMSPNNTKQFRLLSAVLHLLRMTIGCHLTVDLLKLDLSNNGLVNAETIGSGHCASCQSKLTHLVLASNSMAHVPNDSFCQFPSLVILDLNSCNISAIDVEAFAYLKNISLIDLSRNKLEHLLPDLFLHNRKLRIVSLLDNRLTSQVVRTLRPLRSLRYLVLGRNEMDSSDVSVVFEGHPQLQELNADDNRLVRIEKQFQSLNQLWKLSLVSNYIQTISPEAFQSLTSLTSLSLSFNKLTKLAQQTLVKNRNLQYLDLDYNRLEEFPVLQNMSSLRTIKLSLNKLTSIARSHLINCPQITFIDISKNQLESIEKGTFDDIKQLRWLDLSVNKLSSIRGVFQNSNITRLLIDFNNLTTFTFDDFSPQLEHLSIQYNRIKTLDSAGFEAKYHSDGRHWSIHTVHLLFNRIESLENLFLPTSVEVFDVRNNSVTVISYHDSYKTLRRNHQTKLRELNMANNRLSTVCESLVQPIFANFSVDYMLSGNPIECNCENLWLKHMRSRERLGFAIPAVTDLHQINCLLSRPHLSRQHKAQLTAVKDEEFLCSSRTDLQRGRCVCEPELTFNRNVNNHIPCGYQCPSGCECFPNVNVTVAFYFCSNANFTRVPPDNNSQYKSSKLYLFLDGNDLNEINSTDFENFSANLHQLNLNRSKIRSIAPGTFDDLINLEKLNLDGNELRTLPENLFDFTVNLTELHLSDNRLSFLPEKIFLHLKSLQILFLRQNKLQKLIVTNFEQLSGLQNLSLDRNPWSCECTFVETFRTYLRNNPIVPHQNQINCSDSAKGEYSLIYDTSLCQSSVNVTLLIALLILVSGVVTISGFVFYYRHEMAVLIYSRYGVRMLGRKGLEEEEAASKQYDAFIAYNTHDEDFMIHKLLPGLEAIDRPYRVCIHQRDFPAGAYINESILEAVKLSARTIILLTDSFVQSGWCRFEFKTAHVQMLQDRCPRVLLIVVDQIPKDMDPEMKLYLKTNTYLTWGEKLFWKKLYFAMPDKRVTTPKTEIIPMP